MAKIHARSRNTTKIAELQQELGLSERDFQDIVRQVNVRIEEDQRNLDQNEVGRIRKYLNDQKRRHELQGQTIKLPSIVRVQDFADALEVSVGNILAVLLKNGVMANLNDDIDYDTAAIIAQDLGYQTTEDVGKLEKDFLTPEKLEEILKKDPKATKDRSPIVTIMGHVDHGKTTLLDTIRSSNVAKKEAGGITQAISGYQVDHKGRTITFIDTPGHATFEFMRQRGASLADIAILVVAADDGVKPQTKEAVKHAKAAKVPIVVAINKVDKNTANVDKVKKELAEQLELQPEEWGGKTVMVEISALKGTGIDQLLEMVLLASDVEPPKANPDRAALGSVIESHLDTNLGPLATVLIHTGTLHLGDNVVVGSSTGRARRLMDFRGKEVKQAGPSMPIMIIGLDDVPLAGEILQAVDAKEEAMTKAQQRRAPAKTLHKADDDDDRQTLALVLKADSSGSIEALRTTITAMVPADVRLSIIRADVGSVSDSDVLTARAAKALIYAFNTSIGGMAKKLADKENISVRQYDVIYELIDNVREAIKERLPTDIVRTELGTLKVLKVFFATPKRKIIGVEVASGVVEKGAQVIIWHAAKKMINDGKAGKKEKERIGSGKVVELQRANNEISKAAQGDQIGLTYEGKGKIKAGDILEVYREEKVRRDLNKKIETKKESKT